MLYPVTIIVPLCVRDQNYVEFARQAIESALANSCYISIWDDTPSNTAHLVAVLQKEFTLHNVIWNRDGHNRGVSHARNAAVSHAQTDLILPLDGDDMLAPNAVERLLGVYDGTPIYPDLMKFGAEDVPHYRLLDFKCQHLYERVGLASVCVFHSREQWRAVGGWRTDLDFYEDGEYNARLLGTYCGKNLHEPLYYYRQHPSQKTKLRAAQSAQRVRQILSIIGGYEMACCGRGRKSKQGVPTMSQVSIQSKTNVDDLALKQGDRVLALYVGGKGRGKHYRKGLASNFQYRVEYGQYYYVFHEDTRLEQDVNNLSPFVRVVREVQKGERAPVVPEEKSPVLEYEPDPSDFEEAIEGDEEVDDDFEDEEEFEDDDEFEDEELDLVDVINMPWTQFRNYDFSPEEAAELLKMEKRGKNRVKFIAKLEREAKGA